VVCYDCQRSTTGQCWRHGATFVSNPSHPEHTVMRENVSGWWVPGIPLHPHGWFGFKARRACRERGGHWWHPDFESGWGCCQCGARRDGMPEDGT